MKSFNRFIFASVFLVSNLAISAERVAPPADSRLDTSGIRMLDTTRSTPTIPSVPRLSGVAPQLLPIGVVGLSKDWLMYPYTPGPAVLEQYALVVYGVGSPEAFNDPIVHFPIQRLTGDIHIPVFLIDWSDYNPATDLTTPNDPSRILGPGYVKKTPEEISAYLNGPHGAAEYFAECSGGQFKIHFDVYPWIHSNTSAYLKDRSAYLVQMESGRWVGDPVKPTEDVLRAAVAELHVDFAGLYDSDNNRALDGFVIVYEGEADDYNSNNLIFGTAMYWTNFHGINSSFNALPPLPTTFNTMCMNNMTELVDSSDPNYSLFQAQPILYSRYIALPECFPNNSTIDFRPVKSWVHELGHLYMGHTDYYHGASSLGEYALSGNNPAPYQPSAMEKYLFTHWIDATTIAADGTYTVKNSNIVIPNTYQTGTHYLYKILIDDDPYHFLTVENRYFKPCSEGGSYFNEGHQYGWGSATSGLVIFEINQHIWDVNQIQPKKVGARQALIPGDTFYYSGSKSVVMIEDITSPGEDVSFRVHLAAVSAAKPNKWLYYR